MVLEQCIQHVWRLFPGLKDLSPQSQKGIAKSSFRDILFRPAILLHGEAGCGQLYLARAALHVLEEVPVFSLALSSLYGDSAAKVRRTVPMGACIGFLSSVASSVRLF